MWRRSLRSVLYFGDRCFLPSRSGFLDEIGHESGRREIPGVLWGDPHRFRVQLHVAGAGQGLFGFLGDPETRAACRDRSWWPVPEPRHRSGIPRLAQTLEEAHGRSGGHIERFHLSQHRYVNQLRRHFEARFPHSPAFVGE